jgi:hypothetical protein
LHERLCLILAENLIETLTPEPEDLAAPVVRADPDEWHLARGPDDLPGLGTWQGMLVGQQGRELIERLLERRSGAAA